MSEVGSRKAEMKGEAEADPKPARAKRKSRALPIDSHQKRLLEELAGVLGTNIWRLPRVFRSPFVKVLKIGIDRDLALAYPTAEPQAIRDWLGRWTGTPQYLERMVTGRHRHDLHGRNAERISWHARRHARKRLAAIASSPAAHEAAIGI